VTHDEIPDRIPADRETFNMVLAYRDPTQRIVYANSMTRREKHF
jgi:hypothetical protein